jgi:hypothetical protein
MNKYKRYSSGWFSESHRHSLARQGIKTGRKINYSKSVVDNYDIKGLTIQAEKQALESRKERVGFSKEKGRWQIKKVGSKFKIFDSDVGEFLIGYEFESDYEAKNFINSENTEKKLTDFGLKNPTKGKQTKIETEKTKQERLDYQQEITYSPVTVEFNEKVDEIQSHPTLSDEEKKERIQELKHKWREDLKKELEVGKKIGRGVVKVGKGFFSTVASGLSWDPDNEEREPDYSKKYSDTGFIKYHFIDTPKKTQENIMKWHIINVERDVSPKTIKKVGDTWLVKYETDGMDSKQLAKYLFKKGYFKSTDKLKISLYKK